MVNYIEYIIDELQSVLDSNYNVLNAINSLDDLFVVSGKYNALYEVVSDIKDEYNSENYLNKVRKAQLEFMLYIGTQVQNDSTKQGSAITKQAEVWNDLLKKFIDNNWVLSDTDSNFKLNIHNAQLLDYYPINNHTNGNLLIGIKGIVNYSLVRN